VKETGSPAALPKNLSEQTFFRRKLGSVEFQVEIRPFVNFCARPPARKGVENTPRQTAENIARKGAL
jgi:hypothetical protein